MKLPEQVGHEEAMLALGVTARSYGVGRPSHDPVRRAAQQGAMDALRLLKMGEVPTIPRGSSSRSAVIISRLYAFAGTIKDYKLLRSKFTADEIALRAGSMPRGKPLCIEMSAVDRAVKNALTTAARPRQPTGYSARMPRSHADLQRVLKAGRQAPPERPQGVPVSVYNAWRKRLP